MLRRILEKMASSKVLILLLSTLSLFVCFPIFIQGEVVHITVLTRGYTNVESASRLEYQCYASEPDRDASLSFDRSAPITTDRSPPEDEPHDDHAKKFPSALVRVVEFPTGDEWDRDGFGPFYCEASKPDRDVTRVTSFFQRSDAKFVSSDGLLTKTVNVNNTGVTISMTSRYSPDASDNVITWKKDGSEVLTPFEGQTQISFPNPIQTTDQGIYEIYYDNERNQSRGALYRLIVRECPAGKWGPPVCYGICDKCYNGGICDDKSGLCICPNNFMGPNCLESCRTSGGNRFGLNCEFQCSYKPTAAPTQCHGFLFCLPDPYGCSCDVGAHGLACNTLCINDTYGPGCSQTCHCAEGSSCNIYSGICSGGCQTGWSGDNCQIPDECEDGYYGSQCTDKCHCLNDEPCDKQTGECSEQKCALGYKVRSGQVKCQVLPVIEKAPVIVSTTSTTIGLRWNAWSEEDDVGDPPLVGYFLFVNEDGDWITEQRVDQLTTSAIVSNLTPDTEYMFRIAAVREGTGGTGPVSPSSKAITRCRKPSASPTGLQVLAINPKQLQVTWEHIPSEAAECRSGVTQYTIYYASTGSTSSNSLMVPNDTSSYTMRGLDTYLDYTIQTTASNKDEESDRSRETIGKTIEEIAPSPINVAIPQSTTSSFTVSWSTPLPSNINGNIQKYIIRYKRTDLVTDGGYKMEEVLTGAFEGEHTVIDLIAETIYSVQVRTVNGVGSSNWSEPVNAKTIQSGGPSIASIGLIVGGGMAALIIIILVIVLALVIFRRMKQRRSKANPAASPPDNAHENPAFDDSNQDPNTYQDLNADTPNYQNVTDPHAYQGLKKPIINVSYRDSTKSDQEDSYEEI